MNNRKNLLSSINKYLLAAIIILIPLFPKFPLFSIPGTFVSVRLEDLLLLFSALVFSFNVLQSPDFLLQNKISRSVIFFLLSGLISLICAIFVTSTVVPHIGFLHWARRIEYFIPLFLGLFAISKNRENLHFYVKVLLLVVFFTFIYGFGQKYLNWPIIITQNEEYSKGVALRYIPGGHINSTFAGHYDLGTFLVLILPVFINVFVSGKNLLTKIPFGLGIIAGLWLIVNTGSRISFLSYLVAVSLSLLLMKKYKFIPVIVVVSFLFLGFSSNLVSRYQRIIEVTEDKLNFKLLNWKPGLVLAASENILPKRKEVVETPTPTPVFEDRSANIRFNVEWPRAVRALVKNPALGTGYSSISLATDNDYLRLLGEVGIIGFFSFFLIFLRIFIEVLGKFPLSRNLSGLELSFVSGIVGAFPGIFLNAFFIDVFEASKFAVIFWLFTGFSLALLKNEK